MHPPLAPQLPRSINIDPSDYRDYFLLFIKVTQCPFGMPLALENLIPDTPSEAAHGWEPSDRGGRCVSAFSLDAQHDLAFPAATARKPFSIAALTLGRLRQARKGNP
jgi:hypothetical protein